VEPENRQAWITMASTLKRAYKKYKTGVSSVNEATAVGNIAPVYFIYTMNVALTDILTLKILQFQESGIFSVQKIRNYTDKVLKQESSGPQVLTLEHLKAGFVVICGLLTLSGLVFFAECVSVLPTKCKKQIEMRLMSYVIEKFIETNKIL
jgi:hypothetical protein